MGDKELSYNCRLELSKNDLKTSNQIGLPYQPARMSMNEKQMLKIPKMRVPPSLRVDTVYTPHSGYRSTYKEAFKVAVKKDDFIINSKTLKQHREVLRTSVTRPLSFGMTEYKTEYLRKPTEPCFQGISVEKLTTCPMKLIDREQRESLPLSENYGRFLDIYISTSTLAHRAFTLEEQRTIAAKNIVTVYESMDIPKGLGFGCKFPEIPGKNLDERDPDMSDSTLFKTKAKLRRVPTKSQRVPNFGSESLMKASYKKPEGVAVLLSSSQVFDISHPVNTVSVKQGLCPPGMYTTELSAINNHTSPQVVV